MINSSSSKVHISSSSWCEQLQKPHYDDSSVNSLLIIVNRLEQLGLSEAKMFALAQLFDVLPELFTIMCELFPEHFKHPKKTRRLPRKLMHELAPLKPSKPEPIPKRTAANRKRLIIKNDRDRQRRPSREK